MEAPVTVCEACGEQLPADDGCSEVVPEELDSPPAPRLPPANGPAMVRTPHPLPPVPDLWEL